MSEERTHSAPNCQNKLIAFIMGCHGSDDETSLDDDDWDSDGVETDPHRDLCNSSDQRLDNDPSDSVVIPDSASPSTSTPLICIPAKKVLFSDHVKEFILSFEEDRRGPWEQEARNRLRFTRRCLEAEKIIGPCLEPEHRTFVYCCLNAQEITEKQGLYQPQNTKGFALDQELSTDNPVTDLGAAVILDEGESAETAMFSTSGSECKNKANDGSQDD